MSKNIDFSGLRAISEKKRPSEGSTEGFLGGNRADIPKTQENASEGLKSALEGNSILQAKTDRRQREKQRVRAIYSEYQSNIKTSGSVRQDTLRGLRAGDDIHDLFLQVCKGISCMTGDTLFYKQVEELVLKGYGIDKRP